MSEPYFTEWICVFPGKMGISWKRAWYGSGTKEEAEEQAQQNCNVVAIPLALWERYHEYETRMVRAEKKLQELGIDYRNLV